MLQRIARFVLATKGTKSTLAETTAVQASVLLAYVLFVPFVATPALRWASYPRPQSF